MQRLIFATALVIAAPAAAQSGPFTDPAAIDAQVAAFTGAAIGTPGGARHQVDRRLRLAECLQPLALAWHGRGADMVRVECPSGAGWRVFVPVNRGSTTAPAAFEQVEPQIVVERGQVMTVTVEGRGFAVSQQGEALEDGAIGSWIRIRPEGNREVIRAQVRTPQRAVIPLG
ncbi:flagella basal body P-ring formation protein FlgA [Aurantiacibacter poecillastricola]|uniref:flagella basal body P-ring formation protein FlgA n=1 Tax=Aurantiacibacter poecillastricola TaxID=3064385 RepID=UPI00273DD664|nr:flagella basal body P-ring formation protein FlgA [Aurantiacibacter sp. 219JJ12-13]MDP5263106.1 flagella basal body P-ring formation protein FlgA [Aurantiacibacter sp. 219JJ12-13]